ncbi:MAG: ABC transporter permease [Candidatus Thermoplasmatota archaeon]|nr:ABC transporter permease [Candidatus Thermoplasmatota archaeon]
MRDRENRLATRKRAKKSAPWGTPKKLTPLGYMVREVWRNRSRTFMSAAGIASLALLFILFSSMEQGLDDHFRGETEDVPTEESIELFKVKQVMDDWVYLISALCWTLMVLVIVNTATITVVERKFELASLRALGLSSVQVSFLVGSSMMLIVSFGIMAGIIASVVIIPLLDIANLSLLGGGLDLPLVYDPISIVNTLLLGLGAGALGLIPPLLMIIRSSPMEVLRDAG